MSRTPPPSKLSEPGLDAAGSDLDGALPALARTRLTTAPELAALRVLRTIRRTELRRIVPLSDTTIYEMEQRGEFPRRFHLTPRCVAWDLAEVQAWVEARKRGEGELSLPSPHKPDVRQRRARPVRR